MAYDRSEISRKIAQIEEGLFVDGEQPAVGAVLEAVVEARICGRGVAQQILAEIRKDRDTKGGQQTVPTASDAEVLDDLGNLARYFDDLHRAIDMAKIGVGQVVATEVAQVKSSFSAVIAEQGLAGQRAEDAGRVEIERLEAMLDNAQHGLADAIAKLDVADDERAELYARVIEAEESLETQRAQGVELEQERDELKGQVEKLRGELEVHRQDLAAARHVESSLRDELRRMGDDYVARSEYQTLKAQHETLAGELADERARNAELHDRVLRLVGTITQPAGPAAAPVA